MTLSRFVKIAVLTIAAAAPALATDIRPANATSGYGQVIHLNGEGRRICRELRSRSAPYWDAKIRGRFMDRYSNTDRFVIRTCFASRAACLRFTSRIKHRVQGIETIDYARCERR